MDMSGIVFAPQAHDILSELQSNTYPQEYWIIETDTIEFQCHCTTLDGAQSPTYSNKNPHEAAAKAYLQLQNPA